MPVITAGTAGATWGLTAETGIIAQSFSAKPSRQMKEELGPQGDATVLAWYNAKIKYTVAGVMIGTSGIAAANVGVALAIANDILPSGSGYGVTGGNGIYVDDIDIPKGNTEFMKINVSGTKFAIIA